MADKLKDLALTFATAIIGIVVLVSLVAGIYSSLISTLTTLNNTGYNASGYATGEVLQMRTLIAPDGVIPLIVIAVTVIGIIVGLFAMVKKR